MPIPELLSKAEVATVLGCSERTVADLARAYANGNPRGLRGVKVLREWRFLSEDVASYLYANRSPEPSPPRSESEMAGQARSILAATGRRVPPVSGRSRRVRNP